MKKYFQNLIKKAIIPIAGLGTRFLPATKSQPKEMLPIIDKPVVHFIVEEAINSGIEDIIFITGRHKRAIEDYKERTTAEKTWEGLVHYSGLEKERIVLIHRGVDIAEKRDYRNYPVHNLAMRIKQHTGCLLFFDPSHSHGPKMREKILPATIKAMKMKIDDKNYLYDGILIEAGNSETDTEQHITIKELKILCKELSKFRELEGR
jgi:hypothetical protein